MLLQIFKVDDSSKGSAFKVAVFNLVSTVLLTLLMVGFVCMIFNYYDEATAIHVSRLIWIETILNVLFLPFAIILILGVKEDKLSWIKIWIKAKVVQASYIFLLNFVMQVYISASLNFGDGLVVFVYTLVVEVFYLENIIFMNNYHRNKITEDTMQTPQSIPKSIVIRF